MAPNMFRVMQRPRQASGRFLPLITQISGDSTDSEFPYVSIRLRRAGLARSFPSGLHDFGDSTRGQQAEKEKTPQGGADDSPSLRMLIHASSRGQPKIWAVKA